MTIKVDVLGYRWDTVSVGCAFVELVGDFYYHLITKRMYTTESFDAQLAALGKAFGEGEVGIPID